MRITIVSYEDTNGWILGKFARRLCEHLNNIEGVCCNIERKPNPYADINHHIVYYGYVGKIAPLETLMITHIDTDHKLQVIKKQLQDADMGICMSFDTVKKLSILGLPRRKLCFVSPAHDNVLHPKKTNIGITSRVYAYGCKREYIIAQLANLISSKEFRFTIMGSGWDLVVDKLLGKGIEVDYQEVFDSEKYAELFADIDYYLYMGQDEGSMGFLDALAAGIPTIVTPQGFHLDAREGITYAFNDIEDLERIFTEIAQKKRKLVQSIASWTWPEYARRHLLIWEYLQRNTIENDSLPRPLHIELEKQGISLSEGRPISGGKYPISMPTKPGPGGVIHRPRVLVLTDLPTNTLKRYCRILNKQSDKLDSVFNYGNQPYDERSSISWTGWQFKFIDIRSFDPYYISDLSMEHDIVYFHNFLSYDLAKKIKRPSRANYTLYSESLVTLCNRFHNYGTYGLVAKSLAFRILNRLTRCTVPLIALGLWDDGSLLNIRNELCDQCYSLGKEQKIFFELLDGVISDQAKVSFIEDLTDKDRPYLACIRASKHPLHENIKDLQEFFSIIMQDCQHREKTSYSLQILKHLSDITSKSKIIAKAKNRLFL